MLIKAKKVLSQKTYRLRIHDPASQDYFTRLDKLAMIQAKAMEFINDIFLNYELPSLPAFSLVALKGFEEPHADFNNTNGLIEITATFQSLSGITIDLSIPIAISRGEMHRPAVFIIDGKKVVFSQEALDAIVAKTEGIRPQLFNDFGLYGLTPGKTIHQPSQNRDVYQVPSDVTGWSDLIQERY